MAVVYQNASPTTYSGTDVSSFNIAYPSGIAAGKLLTMTIVHRYNQTVTTPSGWAQIGTPVTITNGVRMTCLSKTCTGSESGNLTVSFSAAMRYVADMQLFSGAKSIRGYTTTTATSATSITLNPGQINSGELGWVSTGSDDVGGPGTMTTSGAGWTAAAYSTNLVDKFANLNYKDTTGNVACVAGYGATMDYIVAAGWIIEPVPGGGLFFGGDF